GVQLLSAEQQTVLRQELGGTLLMFARAELARKAAGDVDAAEAALKWNKLAEDCFPHDSRPALLVRQRDVLAGVLPDKAARLPAGPGTATDGFYDAYDLAIAGKSADALHKLIPFTEEHPDHFLAWYARGMCHDAVGQSIDAA